MSERSGLDTAERIYWHIGRTNLLALRARNLAAGTDSLAWETDLAGHRQRVRVTEVGTRRYEVAAYSIDSQTYAERLVVCYRDVPAFRLADVAYDAVYDDAGDQAEDCADCGARSGEPCHWPCPSCWRPA